MRGVDSEGTQFVTERPRVLWLRSNQEGFIVGEPPHEGGDLTVVAGKAEERLEVQFFMDGGRSWETVLRCEGASPQVMEWVAVLAADAEWRVEHAWPTI